MPADAVDAAAALRAAYREGIKPGTVLWGPLRTVMADACSATGLLTPGHPVTRKERAEALAVWFGKAACALKVSELPEMDSAAAILCRWMDECDGQAAAASTGNAAAHLPNGLQARLLRAGVAFAIAIDAHTDGERAVRLVLEMLRVRPLNCRATLDGWAAAVTSLAAQSKLRQRKTTTIFALVQAVAPSLTSDLIHFVTSGGGDANGLSGPAARLIAQLLAVESAGCPVPQQPVAKVCGNGLRTLCSALLEDSVSAHERLCAAVIGPLCKSAPGVVCQLLDNLLEAPRDNGLGSALSVAAVAQNAGGKAAAIVLERLHVETLDSALAHADEALRVAALKLCCQIAAVVPRRKLPNSVPNVHSILPMLRRRLRYCAYGMGTHSSSRQRNDDFISAVGLLLQQFHRALMGDLNGSRMEGLDVLKPTVLEWATSVAEWCGWLRTWLFACLCPGAPFPRVSLTLAMLHEHANLFWRAKQRLPTGDSDAVHQRTSLLDVVCGMRSVEALRREQDVLCLLLESTYSRIRELACSVLLHLDASTDVPHCHPGLAEHAVHLMSSLRLRQFDAGALLMRLLYQRKDDEWWATEFQRFTHRNPKAVNPMEALALYIGWAFDGGGADIIQGSVRCLRYMLSQFSFDSYASDDNAWSAPVGELVETICEKGLDSLQRAIDQIRVLCERKGAPDGNSTLLSGPTDLSTDHQMASVVLKVAELCRLMGTLSDRLGFACSERREQLQLTQRFASSFVQQMLSAALILPHMGAITGVAETLESVLTKLLWSDGCMPIITSWRSVLLENLSGPRILRRSTGMTTAVIALLRPLACRLGPSKTLSSDLQVSGTIWYLINVAAASSLSAADSAQVAALDALTQCFRHRGIMVAAQTEATAVGKDLLPPALQTVINIQNSGNWAAQNSAAQLFGAVAQRLAGDAGLQVGNTEVSRTVTFASCLSAHPSLESVILELIDSTQAVCAKYYLLLFLSMFKPAKTSYEQAKAVAQASRLLTFINTCSTSPSIRLREASAAALVALVPVEGLYQSVQTRVRVLTGSQPPQSANYTNGLWLQLLCLVRSTRLYDQNGVDAVHASLLPLLQDAHGHSFMDPLSRKTVLDVVYELEIRLDCQPSPNDCVDAVVGDLVLETGTSRSSCLQVGIGGLNKRLGVVAVLLMIRRSVSFNRTGALYCDCERQNHVITLLSHQQVEIRHAAARQIKWIVKHRFIDRHEPARDSDCPRGLSHVGWLSAVISRRIVVENVAPVLKQLLRVLKELIQIDEGTGLLGMLSLAEGERAVAAISLPDLTRRLWAWTSQSERTCTTTRALAFELLGCGRGQAKLSCAHDCVLLQMIDCVDWIQQLEDASDHSQQLYLRGHAAETLFVSGALDADGNAQIRAWLLAVGLLQDDDPDVRECARQGLASALMSAKQPQLGDNWTTMSALSVMEASWSYMTDLFGKDQTYIDALESLVAAGSHADAMSYTSRSYASPRQGEGQGHDNGSLWDSNDEEGDNIFVDVVLQSQLASLQLHRCLRQANDSLGGLAQLDVATGTPKLFLLSEDAQESVLQA